MAPQKRLLSAVEKATKARAIAKRKGATERQVLDHKITQFHAQREALFALEKEIARNQAKLSEAKKAGNHSERVALMSRITACEYQLVLGKQFSENITDIESTLRK
ncbi:MAG: hypothetical protein AABW59_00445 [archaeon]